MPAKRRLTMRQLRQMLRLARDGVSAREIAVTLGVARSTIQDNLKRATAAGLSWPLPGEMTDDVLENRLFDHAGVKQGMRRRPELDWAEVAVELKSPALPCRYCGMSIAPFIPAAYRCRIGRPDSWSTCMSRSTFRPPPEPSEGLIGPTA